LRPVSAEHLFEPCCVLDRARAMMEDAVDRKKPEAGDVTLIAVGGLRYLLANARATWLTAS
jgi:hypothetical protein